MTELCEFMLQWFLDTYENGEIPMSPEVYDRACFVVGVGVPMIVFIFVCLAFLFGFKCVCDFIKGA